MGGDFGFETFVFTAPRGYGYLCFCSAARLGFRSPRRPSRRPVHEEEARSKLEPQWLLDAERALELANKAHSLYEMQNCDEQGKLLKLVLSNCSTGGITLWPVYRKPFDMIFNRTKTEEWCARRDSNPRPFGSKPLPGFTPSMLTTLKNAPLIGFRESCGSHNGSTIRQRHS
jgi:hypothetical protein